ncbi:MAG: DUF1801 domain-containing protein [Pseudomonadota bacterium]
MNELKTQENDGSIIDYLASVSDQRRTECETVMSIMRRVTGERPRMWGDSIVGFGRYRYANTKGKEFRWMLTGVAPRKSALTVYIMCGFQPFADLMAQLGRYKTGKSCLYVPQLEMVDLKVLEQLIGRSVDLMRRRYPD